MIPASLPKKLHKPAAVPLIGAGNASGVQAYSTALNMDWNMYSAMLRPMFEAWVLTAEKSRIEAPMRKEEMIMAPLRPKPGMLYV